MRKFLAAAGVCAALLGTGLWWSLRREPAGAPLEEQDLAFTVQPSGRGQLILFQDARIPLRAFRWLPPLPGGALATQTVSQNDRQRVILFHDGQTQDSLLILKPPGVAEGFWRFAVLGGAVMAPNGTVILLYRGGDPASTEPSLVAGVDVASQQVLWSLRGAFERMVLAQGPALYLYGGKNPVLRVQVPAGGGRPAPQTIELPPEIDAVEDLLPTGAGSFLASHRGGLSAYVEGSGWTHRPAPAAGAVRCRDWRSSLLRAGRDLWWQAAPGSLVQVRRDGSPVREWHGVLPEEDPFALDAGLLRVLGAETGGSVWFALASPDPAPAPAPDPPEPARPEPGAPQAAAVPPPELPAPAPPVDWGAYAAAGLDRLYRWDPAGTTLQRVSLGKVWAVLGPPPGVPAPAMGQGVAPQAGVLLAEGTRCAWRLPLQALPLERIPGGGQPR